MQDSEESFWEHAALRALSTARMGLEALEQLIPRHPRQALCCMEATCRSFELAHRLLLTSLDEQAS